jgi:hypothetical protein
MMNSLHDDDDAIEALLRKTFEGPVADDGFAARVMQRLPRRRRRRTAWPIATGILAGAATCWLSLFSAPLLAVAGQDWMNGELSASAITLMLAMASVSIAASWWTLAEGDDR